MTKPNSAEMQLAVRTLLLGIGEDPDRVGLQDTPNRVVKMFKEIYRGYDPEQKPKITTFPNGEDGLSYDEMVCDVGGFHSCCEHHMVPFIGHYYFAYIPHPNGKLLGLSKVARIVDFHSAKLQIQERIAEDVLADLLGALTEEGAPAPLGIALALEATHLCKTMRGVKKEGVMRTVKLVGKFQELAVRQEFLGFVKSANK